MGKNRPPHQFIFATALADRSSGVDVFSDLARMFKQLARDFRRFELQALGMSQARHRRVG